MPLIDAVPFSTAPNLSLEAYLAFLPKSKQRDGQMLSCLLRQRPLSALQLFSSLQKALLATGLSVQGEQDLQFFLMVLSHHAYSESLHPLYAKASTQDNILFWRSCVELEVPLLLAELLAHDALFTMDKYYEPPQGQTAPPPCIYAFISLLHVTRVWALVCRLDNPALRTSSSELVKNVAPVLQRMWGNLWRHKDELFVRVPYSDLAVSVIMELAEKSHEIITRLSECHPDLKSCGEMLCLLFWIWTYAIVETHDATNYPIYLTYALVPFCSHEGAHPDTKAFCSTLFTRVGQVQILSKMASMLADSPDLYGVELENTMTVFGVFLHEAGREQFDRLPVLHTLQRAFARYRSNMDRPSYNYGCNNEPAEYRRTAFICGGFGTLSGVLIGLIEDKRSLVTVPVASDMLDTLLSLLSITVDAMGKFDKTIAGRDVPYLIDSFFNKWVKYCPSATGEAHQDRRRLQLPRPFVDEMRRAAIDQGRWYLGLCELRSANVKLQCTTLLARLIDDWEAFGRVLSLPSEEVMRTALRTSHAQLCHTSGCQYSITKAPKPLKKCVGCGEVYYCSKDCQKRDWTQGGHKSRCRRIGP